MRRLGTAFLGVLALSASWSIGLPILNAQECSRGSLRGNIATQGDQAKLKISGESYRCQAPTVRSAKTPSGPYYTYEVLCNPDSDQGPRTLCSAVPCLQENRSFALRDLRLPDGSTEPAGFECLDPAQADVRPGVSIAEIFAAIRNVKLPGGRIRAVPSARGLANLQSFFWLENASQAPVELSIAGSVLYAEFRVVEYRWSFGGGETLVTEGPGEPGLESEVRTSFGRRGVYPVEVTVVWVAEAFLDGRRVGEVDDLASRAEMSYPVAELRTVLTG
jgi:hypothetical protein